MNQQTLKKLAGLKNSEDLSRAVEDLCRPFGKTRDIRLLHNQKRGEYLCFVEFDPPSISASVIDKLGGINFGSGVAFRIPLPKDNN